MKRLLAFCLIMTLSVSQAFADRIEDSITRQLRGQGFTEIQISRTWLGRSRIVARSPTLYREIIVNPVTGEILRDFWRETDGGGLGRIFNPGSGGDGSSGRSSGGGDDSDRDDAGDDDGGDDGDSNGDSDSDSDGGDGGGDSDGGDSNGGDSDGGGGDDD